MDYRWDNKERRRYIRIEKHFIISYYDKGDPHTKYNVSQLKNISMGGMCFVTSQRYTSSTKMGVELKTPYLADAVHIEGTILESHEKVPKILYETRLAFDKLNTEAELVLEKIVETFAKIAEEKKS